MKKLKNLKVLTLAGMLTAIAIVLGFFKIPVNQLIEIRFSLLPIAVSGMLFGPGVGAVVGILSDIGGYLVRPTGPFFPGFTVSAAVSGAIFGLILHGREASLKRIFAAKLLHTLIVGIVLNTCWLSMLYGNALWAVLTARLPKELVMLPVNTLMLLLVIRPIFGRMGKLGEFSLR